MGIQAFSNKRTSKRYTYLPQARFESQGTSQGIQIRDISKSGLQFFSNSLIPTNAPIVINWQDPSIGNLNPFVAVIRKIDHTREGVFRYCYGSKFFNLRTDTRMNIEKLLVQTKNNELEANKTLINKITVSLLLDLIKQGRPFLQNLLREQNPSTHFQRFLRDIKDYEKKSFNEVDETSQMIQKLVTNNFHCSLLNVGIPLVPKNNEQGFTLYKEAVKKIEMISDLVLEAGKSNASNEVSESRNRLFYNKLELLQTFVETYETNPSSEGNDDSIKKIVSEYKLTSPKPRR